MWTWTANLSNRALTTWRPIIVKQARQIKKLKIVSYDWLEDSLLAKSPKREDDYLWKTVGKTRARKKTAKKTKRDHEIKAERMSRSGPLKAAQTNPKAVTKFYQDCENFDEKRLTTGMSSYFGILLK